MAERVEGIGPSRRRWPVRRAATLAAVGIALCLSPLSPAAHAAPPANDSFAGAEQLAGETGSRPGTNVEASKEPGEPTHGDNRGGRSVWYQWTSPVTFQVQFDTCGSSFDTLLAVYTGQSVSALTTVAENDDSCNQQSVVRFTATAGTVYHIAVDGFDADAGSFTLNWRVNRPPPNDAVAAAQTISGTSGTVRARNDGATAEPGEPARAGSPPRASVWYSWTAPFAGGVGFDTCESNFDTVLAAYSGDSLSSLRELAANDDSCRGGSRIRLAVTAGQTVRVAVDGLGGSAGDFTLSWQLARHPPNDTFSAARRIHGASGAVRGSTEGAVAQPSEPSHAGSPAAASIWYRWRAPRTMGIFFETCGAASFDTVIDVFRGRVPRAGTRVDQNDDACPNALSRVIFVAREGADYLIALDGYAAQTGIFRLRWGQPSPLAEPCRVPEVRGEAIARARGILERANCLLGRIVPVASAIVPRGRIVSQFPPPGTRRPLLTRVNVEVSRGR